MVSQADLNLIQNFAIELEPFVRSVLEGAQEFRRSMPDTAMVAKAVQALGMIRGAGSILMVDPLVQITDMLTEAFDILQSERHHDTMPAAVHIASLASTLPACIEHLVRGDDSEQIVDDAHRFLAAMMRTLVDEDVRQHDTTRLREVLLVPKVAGENGNGHHIGEAADVTVNGHEPAAVEYESGDQPADPELREIFVEEAGELVLSFRDNAITLARSPHDLGVADALRRDAHTLKGAANMTGYPLIGQVGAAVEQLLDVFVDNGIDIDRDTIEMIVVCWKMLPAMLSKLDDLSMFVSPVSSVVRRADDLATRLEQQLASPPPAPEAVTESVTHVEPPADDEALETPVVSSEVGTTPPAERGVRQVDAPPTSSWPAAERLRETTPLEPEPVSVVPEPEPDVVEQQSELSRERLGSALLDLAFAADSSPVLGSSDIEGETGELYDEGREAAFVEEMRRLFAEECIDLLGVLSRAAISLERNPDALAPLRDAVRALHTLKGGAFAAGVEAVADECHQLESVLAGEDRAAAVEAMFASIDRIEAIMGANDKQNSRSTQSDSDGPIADEARLRVPISRLDDMLNLVGELVVNRAGLEQRLERMSVSLGELLLTAERLQRSGASLERQPLSDASRNAAAQPGSSDWDDLEFDRYTEFDRLVRELTEISADVGASVNELGGLRGDLDTVSSRQRRLTSSLQDQLMDIRMVPLASMAPRFYRVIRQVAEARDKDVRLVLEGGETTFDSTLLEALSESMLHLLRNAVDHGIESRSERRRAGKPEEGTIRVRAYRDGGEAVIEVLDDGAGIDEQRVLQRARERGILLADDAARSDVLRMIFQPAFTTRDHADEVSGRGVGLEIVESAVSRFKGRVSIDSAPGTGMAISLRLPVMLSVTQAFMVQAAGATYAVPIGNIDLVADRRETPLSRVGDGLVLETSDGAIPVVDLAQRLGSNRELVAEDDGWIMVASVANERWALCVDELAGQQEIVVKPLGRFVRNSPGVIGATILGNGDVALIVDIVRLLQPDTAIRIKLAPGREAHGTGSSDGNADSRPVALIVDDSLSVRRVVGRTLERNGWQALLARDGQEALDILEAGKVDVMITDIEMPRMDGYELMSAINAHATLSPVPVVVLTSRSGQKHRERAVDLGASAYVVKPFQEQQLLEAVETVTAAQRQAGR